MKSALNKIIAFAMAFLILLSTTSWKVEKHYCMGRLMNIALFSDVETCGMDMSTAHNTDNFQSKSCCDDQVEFLSAQDHLKQSFNDLESDSQSFLIAFVGAYADLFKGYVKLHIPHEHYPPPILVLDIQLRDQVFLL